MRTIGKRVLNIEAEALLKASEKLGIEFDTAVHLLKSTKGRIIVTGLGKSGLIGKKISATFASCGYPSMFVHATDAVHGDLGNITEHDVVIAISYSGETEEVINLIQLIKRIGAKLIGMCGNPKSKLAEYSDVVLDISVEKEACPIGMVPTASTTLALAMGDALAVALMEMDGFNEEIYRKYHPGGQIGKKLLKVKHLMHTGDEVPKVYPQTKMRDTIKEMSWKGLGMAVVINEENKVLGIITDGDLRRLIQKHETITELTAGECMHSPPKIISPDALATEALNLMEVNKITSLIVVDKDWSLIGVIHLHDLWRTEMF
ncbi:MAG: KpsF/GutQ family sugar-phosphate isomerase [Candidatus Hydrogenedentes bacterium]|nr:KpsF/GutQ family sugar-phosphate isomerase [Candidatus Hydrogenedentota bacterium]